MFPAFFFCAKEKAVLEGKAGLRPYAAEDRCEILGSLRGVAEKFGSRRSQRIGRFPCAGHTALFRNERADPLVDGVTLFSEKIEIFIVPVIIPELAFLQLCGYGSIVFLRLEIKRSCAEGERFRERECKLQKEVRIFVLKLC